MTTYKFSVKFMKIQDYIENCRLIVNKALDIRLPQETTKPYNLHKAMRYAVLNGGKRLRSAFIYSTGEVLGANFNILTDICMSIEMIHAFSLIHDDLPALDNDDLRRGKPTCHLAYGEATAILAGDVLQSLAFETITQIKKINPAQLLKMTHLLTKAIGSTGMIGGEELDIEMVGKTVEVQELEDMYRLKTGCLLSASIILAALGANCKDTSVLLNLRKFGEYIGISFQIHDDIIGIESDTSLLGKKQNADIELNKPVYPMLVVMNQAKKRRDELYVLALDHLQKANCSSENLKQLAGYIIERNY
jgi:geranylgeranyl pyrophosphate synthase